LNVEPPSGPTIVTHRPRREPLNHSIFYTDIAGYADPRRDDDDRALVRDALYRILQETFDDSNVPWMNCVHEDRGDGILTIVPPTIPTTLLVDPLLPLLAAKLRQHNRQAGDPTRIQLRAALHVGPVSRDRNGHRGHALIQAARMLDSPVLKKSLAQTNADLAFMASNHVYDTVIRQNRRLVDPAAFKQVQFRIKESKVIGWVYLANSATGRCHSQGADITKLTINSSS
jgi:hypothetical protein